MSSLIPPDSLGSILLAATAELAQAEQDLRKPARYTTARDCAECDGHGGDGGQDPGNGMWEFPCHACHGSGEMSPEREAELRDEDAAEREIERLDMCGLDAWGHER